MARGAITVKIDGKYDDKDINRAIRDLNALKSQSGATAAPMAALGKAAIGMGAAFAGAMTITAVVDALRDAASAAMEDEKSVIGLSTAMRNLGLAHKNSGIEDFISQMQLATGVADTDLRKSYQVLVTATGDAAQAQDLLTTAMDASAATGRSLESVSLAVAKASQGQISALKRLGIPIDENTVKTKNFAAAVDIMNQKFGGQAAAAADTYAGKMARVQQAAGEAQEMIGYALLDAVDNVSEAFGGVGGAQDAIMGFADTLANIITGVGGVTSAFADLVSAAQSLSGATEESSRDWGDFFVQASSSIPVLREVAVGLDAVAQYGENQRQSAETGKLVVEALAAGYQMLLEKINPAAAALRDEAFAAEQAADSTDALKEAQERLNSSLSDAEARLAWLRFLKDLDKTLEGNKRTFDGWGQGARENQDTLIDGFALAETRAKSWAKETGATAAEFEANFAGRAARVVKQFVDDGFKLKDIRAFLKSNGLWTDELAALFNKGKNQSAYDEADRLGWGVGRNVDLGVASGIDENSGVVTDAVGLVTARAIAKANAALGIESPSKVFYAMGAYTVQGLANGITDAAPTAAAAAAGLAGVVTDAARDIIDAQMGEYVGMVSSALGALESYADGLVDKVMGNVDWSPVMDAAGNLDPAATFASWIGSTGDWANAALNMANLIQLNVPPAVMDALLAMTPEQAQAMTNYLMANPWLIEDITNASTQLANITGGLLGVPMAAAWATVGDKSAMAMLTQAKTWLAAHADEFSRWVRKNMSAEIDVVVNYVNGGGGRGIDGKRANGGPVSSGGVYLVGERGPEIIQMNGSGFVHSNESLRSNPIPMASGGNTYAITVQAGVGDPRKIGQEIVEYVRRFEQANGRVFAAA